MPFKFEQSGKNKRVYAQVNDLNNRTRRALRLSFYFIGKELTKEARRSIIKGPKTGRLYRIKGRKRLHRASAPGEPPANLTGSLQKSIDFLVVGSKRLEFKAGNNDVDYAAALEFGTIKIKPRPFMIRAIEAKEKQIESILNGELKKNMDKL
jgi:HK97 gp10 family phage protein